LTEFFADVDLFHVFALVEISSKYMQKRIQIGLVGDFDEKMYTHAALNDCISHCRPCLTFDLNAEWLSTERITQNFLKTHPYNGFWLTPGSPYRNDDGVYSLIRWCRENDFPLLGTCGGFQYMLVEYARNVVGLSGAGHEETEPDVEHMIISKMRCSLKGREEKVSIPDRRSWLFGALQSETVTGRYYCSFGLNPTYIPKLDLPPLRFTAFADNEVRAFELTSHHLFVGTLFQPPLDCTAERPNPIAVEFLKRCSTR